MDRQLYKKIEVDTLSNFVSLEKDFILFSFVRSNESCGIGYLIEARRINFILTRAKYGLIIFGNAEALSSHKLLNNLLNEYKMEGCLVEGADLMSLCPSQITLR